MRPSAIVITSSLGLALVGCATVNPPRPTKPVGLVDMMGTYKGTTEVTVRPVGGAATTESKPVTFTVTSTGVGANVTFDLGAAPPCGLGGRVNGATLEIATPEPCGDGSLTLANAELRGSQLQLAVQVETPAGVTSYKIVGERQP